MAAINSDRASLGLAFDSGPPQRQPARSTFAVSSEPADESPQAQRQRRRSSAPLPPPMFMDGASTRLAGTEQERESGSASHPVSPHCSIPPPAHARRHRSGVIMQRVRGHSGGRVGGLGGFTASQSVGDLHGMGLSITSSPSHVGIPDRRHSVNDKEDIAAMHDSTGTTVPEGPVAEEPTELLWDGDEGAPDNSARFYHRLHSSRAGSPTRSATSVSPSRRSVSPSGPRGGSSPIFARRNLTLPAGGTMPGATLSATLSPNSRFLQQHLPPLFPMSAPESEIDNPHPMVILTPTTQDWRELKELGRLEGEEISTDSDSGSSSSRAPSPPQTTSIVMQGGSASRDSKKDFPKDAEEASRSDPHTPLHSVFNPVIIEPSPVGWTREDGGGQSHETSDFVVNDPDQPLTLEENRVPPVRFNSFGRRDSLKVRERPPIPRTKTKRELERERLFRMVDQEIAEDGPQPESRSSWGVHEIGSGFSTPTGLNEISSPKFDLASPRSESPRTPALDPPAETVSSTETKTRPFSPPKPSPLQTEPLTRTLSDGILGLDVSGSNDGSNDEASPPPEGSSSPKDALPETQSERFEAIRNYSRSVSTRRSLGSRANSRAPSRRGSYEEGNSSPPRSPRRRDTNRVSLVAGRVVQPFSFPGLSPLTSMHKDAHKSSNMSSLNNFSPFRSPGLQPAKTAGLNLPSVPAIDDLKGDVSHAPSTVAPSGVTTPATEITGGVGGHGIDDYVILKEAGKGAYGLVMRAKVKGPNGQPVGDELIIKYVIKSRILADCWKKHKALGPIPVEIHVMDQLRHLIYHPPTKSHPWDPFRARPNTGDKDASAPSSNPSSAVSTDVSRSGSSDGVTSPTQRLLEVELKHLPERGHPNICKLLDFFEDREFYYLVMPRYGTGVDLFDRVESEPAGLEPFEVRSLIGQLADALRFLHANGIVHRDVKDENVILDGTGRCQLIDFGSAAHWRPGKRWDTFSGTLHYASPEIMRGEMYSGKEQDVWALGVVAYVLLVGETPFAELPDEVLEGLTPESRAMEALDQRCGGRHANEGREADGGGALGDAADLVLCCLEQDVKDRPTAEQLLSHRFLAGDGGWVGRRGWKEKGREQAA